MPKIRLVVVQGPLQLMNAISVLTFQAMQGTFGPDSTEDYLLIGGLGNPKMLDICKQISTIWNFEKVMTVDDQLWALADLDFQAAVVALKTNLGLDTVDFLYTCRNWQFINEGAIRAYPEAHKICYGDALGYLDLDDEVWGYTLTPDGFPPVDECFLLAPYALQKKTFEAAPITLVPFGVIAEVIQRSSKTIPGLEEYCAEINERYPGNKTLVTTSNWSEGNRKKKVTPEINEYLACVLPNVDPSETIFIKGHPRQTMNQSALLEASLQVFGFQAVALDEYTEVPIELFLPYLGFEKAITLNSSAAVPLAYFCKCELWCGVGRETLERFIAPKYVESQLRLERVRARVVQQAYTGQFTLTSYDPDVWLGDYQRGPLHLTPAGATAAAIEDSYAVQRPFSSQPIRLHLGCGTRILDGYINIDKYVDYPGVVNLDIFDLPIPSTSVDEIFSEHMLEHLSKFEVPQVLEEWARVVKPGGVIKLNLSNLEWCAREWLSKPEDKRWDWALDTLYGGQTHPGEFRKTGFSEERIESLLEEVGFTDIKICPIWAHKQSCFWVEATRTALVRPGVFYENGFYDEEGNGWRWMSETGQIILSGTQYAKAEVSFDLIGDLIRYYPQPPVNVTVRLEDTPLGQVPFSQDNQIQTVRLIVSPTDKETHINLVSDQYFVPVELGINADQRKLSIHIANLKVRMLQDPVHERVSPNDQSQPSGLAAWMVAAIRHMESSDFSSTEAEVRQALSFRPDDPILITTLGLCLLGQGQMEPARLEFERATQCGPEYAPAYALNAAALLRANRLEEAVTNYRSLQALYPADQEDLYQTILQTPGIAPAILEQFVSAVAGKAPNPAGSPPQAQSPVQESGLNLLQQSWDLLGQVDPMWAIVSVPTKKNNQWDKEEFFKTGQETIARTMKVVQKMSPHLRRRRALDFGCGVGRLTQALAQYFEFCDGVDIAPSMIQQANRYNQYGERCQYHLNSKDDLSLFEDNRFDFIYSFIVLQHIRPEYSRKYIQEFVRVLAPGGLIAFQIPTERDNRLTGARPLPPQALSLDEATARPEQLIEMHGLPREEIVQLVTACGASIVDIQPYEVQDGGESNIYYVTKPLAPEPAAGLQLAPEAEITPDARPQANPAGPKKRAVFTIASKNYLSQARVFSKSFHQSNPEVPVYLLLVDKVEGKYDPASEPFITIPVEELDNIPNPEHLYFKYDVMELNTAVKPYFCSYLFEHFGYDQVIYFDPDILVFEPLTEIWELLETASMVLIPHITQPYTDDKHPNEIDINQSGIYNLGFLGLAHTPSTEKFLAWWQDRLYDFCASDIEKGLFTDQRWVNFAPAMFDGVSIFKKPTYNIAYWNLHYLAPDLRFRDQRLFYRDEPVVFFHFSGFDTRNIEAVSKHQNRYTLSLLPQLRPLFEFYRDLLNDNGQKTVSKWTYAYNYFDNGVKIPTPARHLYRTMGLQAFFFGNPYCTSAFGSYFHWLRRDMIHETKPETLPISNLVGHFYLMRGDLQHHFPNPLSKDKHNFDNWLRENWQSQMGFDPVLLQKETGDAHPGHSGHPANKPIEFGVNISGYLTGKFGNGETARANVRAIQTSGVPFVLNNIVYLAHQQQDNEFTQYTLDNPYPINLIHVNADTTTAFRNLVGQDYMDHHYNIGLWWWELENFPEDWEKYFAFFDEIWTQSAFCQQSISRHSPIPVFSAPHVITLDESGIHQDHRKFGLDPDVFTYLFSFDYMSVFERKNPLALVEAYRQAFGADQRTMLVIKSINAKKDSENAARLRAAVQGLNVRLIEENLSRQDMLNLLATCDCYISLHRSEGFGQGLAEAMYLGKPVIATGYSGNMDFMTPQNSFPVNYRLIPLEQDFGPYEQGNLWADPDLHDAAAKLRLVFDDRDKARATGEQAAADIRAGHNHAVVGELMAARLRQIAQEKLGYSNLAAVPQQNHTAPAIDDRDVDIVIPVYGQASLLEKCVQSVLATTKAAQLFIIDDASHDEGIDRLFATWSGHPRLTLVKNPENLGFLPTSQLGAGLGKAPYILFLNSDTEAVEPGWLAALLPQNEDTAISGARLIYPVEIPGPLAGKIQHAGVARKNNGVPYHPFTGYTPEAPEVSQPRAVNAVTGACLCIRRKVWEELGGWDAQFGRGVYEDVDLCWRARKKGYQVRYQPRAVLYHHESASTSLDGKHTLNEHTRENLEKLLKKWSPIHSDEAIFYGEKTVARWEQAHKKLELAERQVHEKHLPQALKTAEEAVQIAPGFPEALIAYGQLLEAVGDLDQAALMLQQVIDLAPDSWPVRLHLVEILIKLGRKKAAITAYAQLKAVFPGSPELAALGAKLTGANRRSAAEQKLQELFEADDLTAALQAREAELDADLLEVVRDQMSAARKAGDLELAEGLEDLYSYIEQALSARRASA